MTSPNVAPTAPTVTSSPSQVPSNEPTVAPTTRSSTEGSTSEGAGDTGKTIAIIAVVAIVAVVLAVALFVRYQRNKSSPTMRPTAPPSFQTTHYVNPMMVPTDGRGTSAVPPSNGFNRTASLRLHDSSDVQTSDFC